LHLWNYGVLFGMEPIRPAPYAFDVTKWQWRVTTCLFLVDIIKHMRYSLAPGMKCSNFPTVRLRMQHNPVGNLFLVDIIKHMRYSLAPGMKCSNFPTVRLRMQHNPVGNIWTKYGRKTGNLINVFRNH
jgi:hypothetical protein